MGMGMGVGVGMGVPYPLPAPLGVNLYTTGPVPAPSVPSGVANLDLSSPSDSAHSQHAKLTRAHNGHVVPVPPVSVVMLCFAWPLCT